MQKLAALVVAKRGGGLGNKLNPDVAKLRVREGRRGRGAGGRGWVQGLQGLGLCRGPERPKPVVLQRPPLP